MYLTESFIVLLATFQPVFTQPSFATFQILMTGWILSPRHRYVTDLIVSSDSTDNGHFSDYHRFFSHAVWKIDHLWELLAKLIVRTLIANEATIILAGDDRGLSVPNLDELTIRRGAGSFADAQASKKNATFVTDVTSIDARYGVLMVWRFERT